MFGVLIFWSLRRRRRARRAGRLHSATCWPVAAVLQQRRGRAHSYAYDDGIVIEIESCALEYRNVELVSVLAVRPLWRSGLEAMAL